MWLPEIFNLLPNNGYAVKILVLCESYLVQDTSENLLRTRKAGIGILKN